MPGFPEAEADPIFRAILRRTKQPFVILSSDLTVLFANPAFYDHFQVNRDETEGHRIYELGNRQWDIPDLRRLLEEVLAENHSVGSFRVEHEFEQLGPRYMFLDADRIEIEGEPDRILLSINDVTRSEGNQEFQEKLIDSVREGLLVLDWDLRVVKANLSFAETFGISQEEAQGKLVYELGGGEFDIPELRRLLEDILPSVSSFDDFEVHRHFKTIGQRTLLLNGRRIDHLQLILLAMRDVTEQRRAEELRRTVIEELQHRVKNILANISALARQTLLSTKTMEEFEKAFSGRLNALSRVHDLMTSEGQESADLLHIVCAELKALGAREGEDFEVSGPDIALQPQQAQMIMLAVHELATNALKYGALRQQGRIDLTWELSRHGGERRVLLTWRERGVDVTGLERGIGFGRKLLENNLPYVLGGHVGLQFQEEGIECRIEFPLREAPQKFS